jgi:ATP diphosphatase
MVSSMENLSRLLVIMSQLRDPDFGCPWDLKQSFSTILPYTLEEAYELVDAAEREDFAALKDELGDLLFHVAFYAQMAWERDLFDLDDVAKGVCDKLVRRHPHVFTEQGCVKNEEALKAIWERHKAIERKRSNAHDGPVSVMDGVASALPELVRADKLQRRAARVGFDWPQAYETIFKIEEELDEVKEELASGDETKLKEEIGDLLFAVVNLSRHARIDPEQALRAGNNKFESRFRAVERHLEAQNRKPQDCDLGELDALWETVKAEN